MCVCVWLVGNACAAFSDIWGMFGKLDTGSAGSIATRHSLKDLQAALQDFLSATWHSGEGGWWRHGHVSSSPSNGMESNNSLILESKNRQGKEEGEGQGEGQGEVEVTHRNQRPKEKPLMKDGQRKKIKEDNFRCFKVPTSLTFSSGAQWILGRSWPDSRNQNKISISHSRIIN